MKMAEFIFPEIVPIHLKEYLPILHLLWKLVAKLELSVERRLHLVREVCTDALD